MPSVEFTANLARQTAVSACRVEADTVAQALREAFASQPGLRGYVLDEQGELRRHIAVFVDGRTVKDRARLSDAVRPDSEIFVMQALSGG